jgi:hypothetical protein
MPLQQRPGLPDPLLIALNEQDIASIAVFLTKSVR